jgi:anti-sigma28 factor (negative regulator of flagellin synthesis)
VRRTKKQIRSLLGRVSTQDKNKTRQDTRRLQARKQCSPRQEQRGKREEGEKPQQWALQSQANHLHLRNMGSQHMNMQRWMLVDSLGPCSHDMT